MSQLQAGPTDEFDARQLQQLEEKFDPEMRFRPTVPPATVVVKWLLIALSVFHYYTAGFGLLRETTHRGVHLAFVLGLIFVVFAGRKHRDGEPLPRSSWLSPGGVPLVDWLLGVAVAVSVLYIPYVFDDLAFRVGNPLLLDVVMGSILIVVLLGYAFFRLVGGYYSLASIGLISFAAVAQFAPPIIAGLYWKEANLKGAVCGLSAGFAVWLYTLILPAFAEAGALPEASPSAPNNVSKSSSSGARLSALSVPSKLGRRLPEKRS